MKPILLDSGGVVPPGLFLGENRTGGPEHLTRVDGSGSLSQVDVPHDGGQPDRLDPDDDDDIDSP